MLAISTGPGIDGPPEGEIGLVEPGLNWMRRTV